MLPWLRDFTDLPLGRLPEPRLLLGLGLAVRRARRAGGVRGARRRLARGGSPDRRRLLRHVARRTSRRVRERLEGTAARPAAEHDVPEARRRLDAPDARPWRDEARPQRLPAARSRTLTLDPDVFVPTLGSLLVWKHLFRTGDRARAALPRRRLRQRRPLGQLALNGAEHVTGSTSSAPRWRTPRERVPERRLRPRGRAGGRPLHGEPEQRLRPGGGEPLPDAGRPVRTSRAATDRSTTGAGTSSTIPAASPALLEDDGVALVMQLSILSQLRTDELLDERGLAARVIDFTSSRSRRSSSRTWRRSSGSSGLSDAYHLALGDERVLVAYLLELGRT